MERVYFIYSFNIERDNELVKKLHRFLPMNIDIAKVKIEDDYLVDLSGKKEKQMPYCMLKIERPIYITEDALEELIKREQADRIIGFSGRIKMVKFLSIRHKNLKNLILDLIDYKEIICEETNINRYIDELKKGNYFIF